MVRGCIYHTDSRREHQVFCEWKYPSHRGCTATPKIEESIWVVHIIMFTSSRLSYIFW